MFWAFGKLQWIVCQIVQNINNELYRFFRKIKITNTEFQTPNFSFSFKDKAPERNYQRLTIAVRKSLSTFMEVSSNLSFKNQNSQKTVKESDFSHTGSRSSSQLNRWTNRSNPIFKTIKTLIRYECLTYYNK